MISSNIGGIAHRAVKALATLISVIAFGISVIAPAISHAAPFTTTLYVNAAIGSDTTNTGLTPSSPFLTIQAALNAATSGDQIDVAAGTYTETVTIPTSVTLVGATGADLVGEFDVDAPSTSISGFSITNPTGDFGVLVNGVSGVTISDNSISNIGTSMTSTHAYGVWFQGSSTTSTASGLTISDNSISNIGEASSNYTNGAIGVGSNASAETLTGLVISGNTISSVASAKGAYGLLLDLGSTGGATISGASIANNDISSLTGGWEHAIGLETNTPSITLTRNTVHDLGTASDVEAIHFELNPTASAALLTGNTFNGHSLSNAVATTTVDAADTVSTEANTYNEVLTNGTYSYAGLNAFPTIQAALAVATTSETIQIDPGTYSADIDVPVDGLTINGSGAGTTIINSNGNNAYGDGITDEGHTNFTLSNVTFNISPTDSQVHYAFTAYQATGVTLTNDVFNGVVKNASNITVGGVDENSSSNVVYNNVTSSGFGKNGFSVTSAYYSTDAPANGITFNGVTASHNGWTGISLYTTSNSGGAASITGVSFTGANTLSNNGAGIFVEGDTDANLATDAAPRYTVTSPGSSTLNLGDMAFSGNTGYDIENYQTDSVNATNATYGGLTWSQLTPTQQSAEEAKTMSYSSSSVTFGVPAAPTNLTAMFQYDSSNITNGAYLNITAKPGNNNLELNWTAPTGTVTSYQILDTYPDGTSAIGYQGPNTNAWLQYNGFGAHGDGTYTYQVVAVNAAGSSVASEKFTIIYDTTAPVITSITPADGKVVKGTQTFTVDATDANPSFIYEELNQNGAWISDSTKAGNSEGATQSSITYDTTTLADGTYTIKVDATDKAGNNTEKEYTFVVDNTAPAITSFTPADGTTISGTTTFTAQDSDAHASYMYVELNQNGNWITDDTKSGTSPSATEATVTYDTTKLTNGIYTIKVDAVDQAGNTTEKDYTFTVDNTPVIVTPPSDTTAPSVPVQTYPADAATLNTNSFTYTWDASTDASNNPVTYQVQVATNPSETNGVLNNVIYTSPVLTTNSLPSNGAPDATYYWQVRATDSVGGMSPWSPIESVTLDTSSTVTSPTPDVAPTASIIFPGTGSTDTSFQVVFSKPVVESEATDPANYFLQNYPGAGGSGPLTGNATVTYDSSSNTATVTFTTAGWYLSPEQEWGVQNVHDLAGTVLATNPTIAYTTALTTPTAPGAPTTTTPTTATSQTWIWDASTDTGAAISSYTYSVTNDADGSIVVASTTLGNVTTVTTSLPAGSYTMHVNAEDVAGNVSPESTGQVTVGTVDASPSTTTNPATNISDTDATLHGAVPSAGDATQESFWISTSTPTIDTSNPNQIPDGVYSTPVLDPLAAGSAFQDQLSIATTQGIPANLGPITPSTTYYYVAWALVNGTWYPGTTQSFTTLATPPQPLSVQSTSISLQENASTTVALAVTTPGVSGSIAYSVITQPAHGTLSGTAPNLIYTPATGYFGGDSFTYNADGGTTGTISLMIAQVVPVNHVPVATAVTASSELDAPVTITLAATDADGDTLTYATSSSPSNGTLGTITGNTVVYTPNANYSGSDSFNFTVSDAVSTSIPATVTISVTPSVQVVNAVATGNGSVSGGSVSGGTIFHANTVSSPGTSGGGSVGGGQVLGASTYNFGVDLKVGSRGEDVTQLQTVLIADGFMTGTPTGYFGAITKAAVKKFQTAYNISPISGYVGPITRAILNAGTTPTSSQESASTSSNI